jgi:hypothetical protein
MHVPAVLSVSGQNLKCVQCSAGWVSSTEKKGSKIPEYSAANFTRTGQPAIAKAEEGSRDKLNDRARLQEHAS